MNKGIYLRSHVDSSSNRWVLQLKFCDNFSPAAPKDGNNVYHSVNNGYASFNRPTLALTTYKPAATPAPLPSTTTSYHWQKELDKKSAGHQSFPSTAD
jgi:hypothetical protein